MPLPDWLEFEEMVGRRWHRWAARAASYPAFPEAAARLETLRDVLATCFRAHGGPPGLTVDTWRPRPSGHRLGLRQRLGLDREYIPVARRDSRHLVLPERIDCFPDPALNREAYFWLVAFLAHTRETESRANPLQQDVLWLHEVARTIASVCRDLPGMARRYARLGEALLSARPQRRLPEHEANVETVVRALLGADPPRGGTAAKLFDMLQTREIRVDDIHAPRDYRPFLPVPLWGPAQSTEIAGGPGADDPDDTTTGTVREAVGARHQAARRNMDQTERNDPLMLNIFEKILSWAEMVNLNRRVEDSDPDEARRAADQLDELALADRDRRTGTRLRMNLEIPAQAVDDVPLEAALTYPEWHYHRNAYLSDHTTVLASMSREQGESWRPDPAARRRIAAIRRQFEALRPRRETLRRQLDGSDLDTDAVVRSRCDLLAGGPGSDRIYTATRQQQRDLAIALLVDTSLSTESWIEDRRVLDIEKEALLALVHGLHACGDDHAVFTFSSQRRHRVRVRTVKAFSEPLSAVVERRIQALAPGRYTRMGAAIRHVTKQLADRPNRHRLLLALTDGKPNDNDHYEGRFALEDTRKAVLEARSQGLSVFGVTIDHQAQDYFPYLFGPGGFTIIRDPAGLPGAMPGLFRALLAE